jgi:hypothetical protein
MLESVFRSPVLHSFQELGPLFMIPGGGAANLELDRACSARSTVSTGTAPGEIPDSVLGHVFYYQPSTSSYVRSADTSGPAAGARFLLYEVDSIGRPAQPLVENGYFDLTNESGDGGPALRGMLSGRSGSGADYTVTVTGRRDEFHASLRGLVGDGVHTLTFTDSLARWFVQGSHVAAIRDTVRGTTYLFTATLTAIDPFDSFYDVDLTVSHGRSSTRLYGSVTTFCLIASTNITIAVDGVDIARTRLVSDSIERLDGLPLSQEQRAAFATLLRVQRSLFGWLEAFVTPTRQLLAQ